MTSTEYNRFSGIVKSKLGEVFTSSDAMSFSIDNESSATGPDGNAPVDPRLMRVVSSLESRTPKAFYPVRCLSWYALSILHTCGQMVSDFSQMISGFS